VTALTDEQLVKLEGVEAEHTLGDEEEEEGFEWIAMEPEPKRARTESVSPTEMPIVSSASSLAVPVVQTKHEQHEGHDEPDDEDSLFCKSVSHTLKRLAPRRKALAKLRVLQALYDAEFGSETGPDLEVRLRNAEGENK
jgi:hypothetical protein